jgi:hypothetical protein
MAALEWAEVARRFQDAASWWVATTGPAGPHAVPVWGVVVDDVLSFYGGPDAVRSRNLAVDPRLVLHLESASDVLILHGTATVAGPAGGDPGVNAAYAAKYTDPTDLEYLPDAPANEAAWRFAVTPVRAVAWRLGSSVEWENRRWSAGG